MDTHKDSSTRRTGPKPRTGTRTRAGEELSVINDAIQAPEWACSCGARATGRRAQARCRKCRSRERWHRRQDGARRHRKGDQW